MNAPEATTPEAKTVAELLEQIRQKASGGDYIYRGESKKHPQVTSTLYRDYQAEIDTEHFDIEEVEKAIIVEVKERTHEKEKDVILEQLQHYGGKTNQIDFSTDFFIALFFACDGNYDKNGRLILLNKEGVKTHKPTTPQNRVIAQKSIFVRPSKGFIEIKPEDQVTVPSGLKKDVLEYLNKYHSIRTATIYNDIHGYISQKSIHQDAYIDFYRGVTYQSKGEDDKAIKAYTESIKLNPSLAVTYNNRGNAYASKGDYDLALSDFNQAIELTPNDAIAYSNRAIAYVVKNKYDLAIADYSRAIELDPNDVTACNGLSMACNNRGNIYNSKGEHDLAITDYNKAIEMNPNDAMIYTNRGDAYNRKGEYDIAIIDYNKAIKLDLNYAKAYNNRSIAKRGLQDYKGEKEDLETALRLAAEQENKTPPPAAP